MKRNTNQRGFGAVEIIIIVVVLALIGIGGWYVWQGQGQKNQSETSTAPPNSQAPTTQQPTVPAFKIKELGVEFDEKGDINALYKMTDYNFSGVNYKLIRLSTQQLVDKGNPGDGSKNPCAFDITAPWGDADHALATVSVFNSQSDLMAVKKNINSPITADDIRPEKGYIAIGAKIFEVPLPGTVQGGSGTCISDVAFQGEQRTNLAQSLMTLRASK